MSPNGYDYTGPTDRYGYAVYPEWIMHPTIIADCPLPDKAEKRKQAKKSFSRFVNPRPKKNVDHYSHPAQSRQ